MQLPQLCTIVFVGLCCAACSKGPAQTGKGFYLPAGSAQRGQVAFVEMKCHECHSIAGVDLPARTTRPLREVQLGGEVSRVRSYGDLVTSIIYPSHAVSDLLAPQDRRQLQQSPMPVHETMTVVQLVDIVTFLQPYYKQRVPETYGYGYPVAP